MKNNGDLILRATKHTLKSALFEKSRLKYTSNTINSIALLWYVLFRGTERNQRGIFRKMLKRGTIVSKTTTSTVAGLWRG